MLFIYVLYYLLLTGRKLQSKSVLVSTIEKNLTDVVVVFNCNV